MRKTLALLIGTEIIRKRLSRGSVNTIPCESWKIIDVKMILEDHYLLALETEHQTQGSSTLVTIDQSTLDYKTQGWIESPTLRDQDLITPEKKKEEL